MSGGWWYLFIGGVLEIPIITLFRHSEGMTKLWPSVSVVALVAVSFVLFARAVKLLPLSTVYPVWFAIGSIGVVAIGAIAFQETLTPLRGAALAMIIGGVLLLKWADVPG